MAVAPLPIVCTPEIILPRIPCLICGKSRQELLAAFDALLCTGLHREDCSVSSLLPFAAPYMIYSERDLVAASTYLWLVFLGEESPETQTSEQAISMAVSPFAGRSQLEVLAMQLWLLCQLSNADCTADTLIDAGRCYCVSLKDLLAIRVYLLGVFVSNFVEVNMDPNVLRQHAMQYLNAFSVSTLEAASVWAICTLYNVALENQPT